MIQEYFTHVADFLFHANVVESKMSFCVGLYISNKHLIYDY